MGRARIVTTALLLVTACAARRPGPSAEFSGSLDDYSLLRQGGPGEVALLYRNPQARWTSYDKVLFEPVTLWRSGRKSLDPIPEGDLLRLITDLENAVRGRLGTGFELVKAPAPGTMRIRLATANPTA